MFPKISTPLQSPPTTYQTVSDRELPVYRTKHSSTVFNRGLKLLVKGFQPCLSLKLDGQKKCQFRHKSAIASLLIGILLWCSIPPEIAQARDLTAAKAEKTEISIQPYLDRVISAGKWHEIHCFRTTKSTCNFLFNLR